jgi:hypothetical protein
MKVSPLLPLLVLAVASPAFSFILSRSPFSLRNTFLPHSGCARMHRAMCRSGVGAIRATIDRRSFIAAAGALFTQIDTDGDGTVTYEEFNDFFEQVSVPALPTPASSQIPKSTSVPKKEVVDKIANGLLRLSNQVSYEGKSIGLFSDGTDIFAAAEMAVKQVGGTAVLIDPKGDIDDIRYCILPELLTTTIFNSIYSSQFHVRCRRVLLCIRSWRGSA